MCEKTKTMKFYGINQLKPFLERNITVKMNTTLHVYLVTYKTKLLPTKLVTKSVTAYSKKEAGDIFVKWAKGIDLYDGLTVVCVQTARKTKHNKRFYTKDFYDKQNWRAQSLYDVYLKKVGNKNE